MAERNFANRTVYHGDNLDFLRGMNSETVDLIATDPPFNKNRDFHATPDSLTAGAKFVDRWRWEEDVHEDWVDSIKDNWPGVWAVIESARVAYGQDMAAFLCWLGVRLLEMHRILKPTGSLYLHIDHTAHAYVKTLLDAIFGKANFRNEIVWHYSKGFGPRKDFRRKHDTILRYGKGADIPFNRQSYPLSDSQLHRFNLTDDDGRKYRINHVKGSDGEYKRFYLDDGVPVDDVWSFLREPHYDQLPHNAKERTGYPTQKPLALYERIIMASTNPGDVVLDPFCGCATTPVAAERLGREWVGMDIWEGAHQQVLDRLELEAQLSLVWNKAITYATTPPERTDADEIPVPNLKLRIQRAREPWERLTNREVRGILEKAQADGDLIGCAGCGRFLEGAFMELDHIQPKAENGPDHLLNRILLCGPCNGRKSNQLTMAGLRRQNGREGWMRDRRMAEQIQQKALLRATQVRDNWPAEQYR